MNKINLIPPSPALINELYRAFLEKNLDITFKEYLESIGLKNHGETINGLDDGILPSASGVSARSGPDLIDVPAHVIKGTVKVKVLLVDFNDKPAPALTKEHYRQLLFSVRQLSSGSMRDYYREVSAGKVDVDGTIDGWLRMPQPYTHYTGNQYGIDGNYPNNARKLTEDALSVALAQGITFEPELDLLGTGFVTALFIIHSGVGAETNNNPNDIWSHKWQVRNTTIVGRDLRVSSYLMVPHDCKVGVCAHELGHLVFQWEDFYDVNRDDDNNYWAGTGFWDLMASGSWGNGGSVPTHPMALHKLQHKWVKELVIEHTTHRLSLAPIQQSGVVVKIRSNKYKPKQYLLLENRTRTNFDRFIPGEGLLVWRIDEAGIMSNTKEAAALLLQADGLHQMEKNGASNQGDDSDPFPGSNMITQLLSNNSSVTTSFAGIDSGIKLSNISLDASSSVITLDIEIAGSTPPPSILPGLNVMVDIRFDGERHFVQEQFAGSQAAFRRVERFKANFNQRMEGLVLEYSAEVDKVGNTGFKQDGSLCGIKGSKITAFNFRLSGNDAHQYQILYKGVFKNETSEWTKNGDVCSSRSGKKALKGFYLKIERA